MAEKVLTDPFFSVGGVDLSSYVRSITVDYGADAPELTAGGDDTHIFAAGALKNWSVQVNFNQDYAASQVDATLFPAVGTSVALVIRPDTDAVGTANPQLTGNGILTSYQPLGGNIGELIQAPVTFVAGGTLSRATS